MARYKAFTLIEMLVVIAIIGILAALIGNAVMNSLRTSRIASCMNNLKQNGNLVMTYRNDWDDRYPPWLSTASSGKENLGLFVCPLDDSGGAEGSRPDWITDTQYAETNDMPFSNFTPADQASLAAKCTGSRTSDNHQPCEAYRVSSFNKCGYLYEFNYAPCSWYNGEDASPPDTTWQQAKLEELKNPTYRPFVPVVRCYFHNIQKDSGMLADDDQILNLRNSGEVNNSPPTKWWVIN